MVKISRKKFWKNFFLIFWPKIFILQFFLQLIISPIFLSLSLHKWITPRSRAKKSIKYQLIPRPLYPHGPIRPLSCLFSRMYACPLQMWWWDKCLFLHGVAFFNGIPNSLPPASYWTNQSLAHLTCLCCRWVKCIRTQSKETKGLSDEMMCVRKWKVLSVTLFFLRRLCVSHETQITPYYRSNVISEWMNELESV